jgi:transcription antitermination factor NusG
VNSIVGIGKNPIPILQRELDDVRTVLSSGAYCEPWPFLEIGQTVEVQRGPLAGTHGFVVRAKNTDRFVISVNLLQRSVAVEIDRDCLKPVTPKTTVTISRNLQNPRVACR